MKRSVILILFLVLLSFFFLFRPSNEGFQSLNTTAVCIITRSPTKEWLSFLDTFTKYNVYMVIDDETIDIESYSKTYPNVNIIQVSAELCRSAGFKNASYVTLKKDVIAWDKALYYFSIMNTSYNYVWFIEDDVYFKSEETLLNIDAKYNGIDLLCKPITKYHEGNDWPWWSQTEINLPQPYHNSLVCGCRISKPLLSEIKRYSDKNGTLFFIEALFATLAVHAGLSYEVPFEFSKMEWNTTEYSEAKGDIIHLYHPIKDFSMHSKIRSRG